MLDSHIHVQCHDGSGGGAKGGAGLSRRRQESDKYMPYMSYKVNFQRLVIKVLMGKPSEGSLAGDETTMHFDNFVFERRLNSVDQARCFRILRKVSLSAPSVRQAELVPGKVGSLQVEERES